MPASFRLEAIVVIPRPALPRVFSSVLVECTDDGAAHVRMERAACDSQDEEMGAAQIEKGKPVESRGRKASGLQNASSTTAGLPIESQQRFADSRPHSQRAAGSVIAHLV